MICLCVSVDVHAYFLSKNQMFYYNSHCTILYKIGNSQNSCSTMQCALTPHACLKPDDHVFQPDLKLQCNV